MRLISRSCETQLPSKAISPGRANEFLLEIRNIDNVNVAIEMIEISRAPPSPEKLESEDLD